MQLELVCQSSGDNSNRPCSHNWVIYTPFRGEAYICCAKAGCGILKEVLDANTSDYKADLSQSSMYGMSYGEYGRLPVGTKSIDRSKDNVICPVVSDYNKARLNKKYGR